MIRNNKVPVKTIVIQDLTSKAKCSLWRDHASTKTRPGDFVTITDVIVNCYREEISFSSTQLSTIQNVEAPEEKKKVECVGGCLEDLTFTLLLNDDTEIGVPIDLMEAAFPGVEQQELEQFFLKLCRPSVSLTVTYSGTAVVKIEFET